MKNGIHVYLDCIARCVRGFRCKQSGSRVAARRVALLCVADGQEPMRRTRLPALLTREIDHANR